MRVLHILPGYWATSLWVTLLYHNFFSVRMIFLFTCETDWNIPTEVFFLRSYLVTGGALCSPYIWFVIGFKILSFLFKSLFCLGFIFQYEVLLIYSSLISLPYHVGLLGLIYDPTVSYNLHGFAGLFHPLDIPLLYQTAQSSCISKVSPDLSSDNMFLKALDCCFPMNSRKLTEVKKQKTQRSV